MTIAAASIGPNAPITMRTVLSIPPARWESSQNGHENAYANAKNQMTGCRPIRVSDGLVEVEFGRFGLRAIMMAPSGSG